MSEWNDLMEYKPVKISITYNGDGPENKVQVLFLSSDGYWHHGAGRDIDDAFAYAFNSEADNEDSPLDQDEIDEITKVDWA